jgi:hypothetical protein
MAETKYLDGDGMLYSWQKIKAGNVASATKATQDSAGNVIADTYALKTDVKKIEIVTVLPTTPDSNTIYLIQGS